MNAPVNVQECVGVELKTGRRTGFPNNVLCENLKTLANQIIFKFKLKKEKGLGSKAKMNKKQGDHASPKWGIASVLSPNLPKENLPKQTQNQKQNYQ